MSYAAEPALRHARSAPKFSPSTPILQRPNKPSDCRPRNAPSGEEVLQHYLRRVDPQVADSFTAEQREAIKAMLGGRGIARHAIEIRHSLPFGRRRFYMVLLMGREQRSLPRLAREAVRGRPLNLLVYLGLAALFCAPALGVFLALAR